MTSHNHQKKIAVINDISGFGRCSIAVSLPIISMLKVQCCPLPTSIFSNHTGFPSFFFEDFTKNMEPYMEEWKKLELKYQPCMPTASCVDTFPQYIETLIPKYFL